MTKQYKLPDQEGWWRASSVDSIGIDGVKSVRYFQVEEEVPEVCISDAVSFSGEYGNFICTGIAPHFVILTTGEGRKKEYDRDFLEHRISSIWRDGKKIYQRRS